MKVSDEETKKGKRVKREVGGEEKCSECQRAAQLEERMECGRHSSSIAESSMRLSPGSVGEQRRARKCFAPRS